MAWSLYYLNKHGVTIETETADEVIISRDCIGLVLLYLSGNPCIRPESWTSQSLSIPLIYTSSTNIVILLYFLFRDGKLANPYASEDAFEILNDNGVVFMNMEPVP